MRSGCQAAMRSRTAAWLLTIVTCLMQCSGWTFSPLNTGSPTLQVASPKCRLRATQCVSGVGSPAGRLRQRPWTASWLCLTSDEAGETNIDVDLVILVGFLGCTRPILSKYSAVYEELGIKTMNIIPSIPSMFLAHQGFRGGGSARVRQLCKQVQEEGLGRRIVLHVFSNNGFIFLSSCLRADPAFRSRFAGVILDSCPCLITPEVAATGLISAVAGRDGADAKQNRLFGAVRGAMGGVLGLVGARQEAAWAAWEQNFVLAPHLFLYSEGDAVIAADEIESTMTALRGRLQESGGYACESRKWREAEHCAMLRVDPEGYTEAIVSFLSHSLASNDATGRKA